jgi:hypothetical protein
MRRLLSCLLLAAAPAHAAELISVEFDRRGDHYVFESEAWFDTDVESLYAVFLDYDLSTRFSSAIVEARNEPPGDDGRPRFYVRNEGCVLFFCKSFERYGWIEAAPGREIRASADAELSDFHFSDETWTFAAGDDGTTVHYRVEFQPKFWVPPVIGPWVIGRTLRAHGGRAINRIEAIAQEYTP